MFKNDTVVVFGMGFTLTQDPVEHGGNKFVAEAVDGSGNPVMIIWNVREGRTEGDKDILAACDWNSPYEVYPISRK